MTASPAPQPSHRSGSINDPYVGVPDRPLVRIVLRDDGSGTVNGQSVDIPPGADRHLILMTRACRIAFTLGRPVRVIAGDSSTEWELVAHPDGDVVPVGAGKPRVSSAPTSREVVAETSREVVAETGREVVAETGRTTAGRPGLLPRRQPSTPVVERPVVERPSSRSGAVSWSVERSKILRTPSLPVLGGLVIVGLLLASAAVVRLPGGDAATSNRVVATVTAPLPGAREGTGVPAGRAPGSVAGLSPLAPSGPASLSVAVPSGFATKPAWTVPIAAWTRSVAADGGTILSRDPQGHILLIDPATGSVRWRSAAVTSASQEGPWLARIGGRPVAAVVGAGTLSYWTLPSSPGVSVGVSPGVSVGASPGVSVGASPGASDGISIRLPAGTKVSWVGGSPLVTSPGGGVGVITSGGYRPVALPPHGRGLATDGSTVLVLAGETFARQTVGQSAVRPRALPRPRGAGRHPARVEAVGPSLLLTVWPRAKGRGQIAGLVETVSGKVVVQTDLEASLDLRHAAVIRETAGTQTLLGSVLVDTYTSNLNLLDPRYTVRGVTRGHAWAMFQGRATDIHLDRAGDFRTVAFPAGDPAFPVGVVAAAGRGRATVVVVAPAGNSWVLCGLTDTSSPAR